MVFDIFPNNPYSRKESRESATSFAPVSYNRRDSKVNNSAPTP